MSNPYFLTRQTANLMEDFARALQEGGSLYLLYGEQGVGKTRLLRELRDQRLAQMQVHWIDMRGVADGQIVQMDRSRRIEEVFDSAESGDVVVADHFEFALKKTRHQLFLSWSSIGRERGINLIVASSTEGFDEMRQLAQHYQVEMQSFRLEPFGRKEVDAFLGFHLFPEHPLGRLEVPGPLRRQLDAAGGNVSRLIELADTDGSQIRIHTLDGPEPNRFRLLVGFVAVRLCLSAIVTFFGWYLANRPEPSLATAEISAPAPAVAPAPVSEPAQEQPAESPPPETAPVTQSDPQVGTSATLDSAGDVAESAAEGDGGSATVDAAVDEQEQASVAAATETPDAESAMTETSAPETMTAETVAADVDAEAAGATPAEPPAESTSAAADAATVASLEEASQASERVGAEPDIVSADSSVSEDVAPPPADVDARFQRRIEASLDWLNDRATEVGTVQIMLLGFEGFDPDAYFENVERLARGGVDPEQIYIIKTLTAGRVVYSVFYSEYPSRRAALRSISDLPEVLRELGPIGRSVGGIQAEIRRLEGQN